MEITFQYVMFYLCIANSHHKGPGHLVIYDSFIVVHANRVYNVHPKETTPLLFLLRCVRMFSGQGGVGWGTHAAGRSIPCAVLVDFCSKHGMSMGAKPLI